MKKTKSIALVLGVLILSLTMSYLVFAWTEPGAAPPSGNVAVPLNEGLSAQSKLANLTFPAFYDYNNITYYVDPSAAVSALFAGNVGIGTTSPGGKLHVVNNAASSALGSGSIMLGNLSNPNSGWAFRIPDTGGTIDLALNRESGGWQSTPVMYFQRSTGNVGIGTTSPGQKLEVSGNIKSSGAIEVDNGYAMLSAGGISAGNVNVDYTPTSGNWTSSGTTLLLSALNYSVIGFQDYFNRVDFIRVGAGTIKLGYNGGWGEANIGMPGVGIWNSSGNVGIGTTSPQSRLQVVNNYIQFPTISGAAPSAADCDSAAEAGRIVVKTDTANLYICTGISGWVTK